MLFDNMPIRKRLMTVILSVSGAVIVLTCLAFVTYEVFNFRQNAIKQLSTIGEIVANNSTASLAFDNPEDATELLENLGVEVHVEAAGIYDEEGKLFAWYPDTLNTKVLPAVLAADGYRFQSTHLEGFQPIVEGEMRLGTLYLRSNLTAVYERFRLYAAIVVLVMAISLLLAYLLSRVLQQSISKPILELTETARRISGAKDYSVRASKTDQGELGVLTDAFNQMLEQIEMQNRKLSKFNQQLERKVEERTKELKAANKELESFSYSVSHDLRAPARAVHGYIRMLSKGYSDKLDEEGNRLLETVLRNAKKMGELIDDLLSFSHLGRKELEKEHISMTNMVQDVWDELYALEKDREIEFNLDKLPDAKAEATTIRQVWINLLSNALKYSRNRKKAIIRVSFKEEEGAMVYFVSDNGTGFDMQYYNMLFGIFQRLHSQDEFEGTGVGLAIVQRIVEKHGGTIWAEAKPDQGATFYFSLSKKLPAHAPAKVTEGERA